LIAALGIANKPLVKKLGRAKGLFALDEQVITVFTELEFSCANDVTCSDYPSNVTDLTLSA
jgi:hypothetical protein